METYMFMNIWLHYNDCDINHVTIVALTYSLVHGTLKLDIEKSPDRITEES